MPSNITPRSKQLTANSLQRKQLKNKFILKHYSHSAPSFIDVYNHGEQHLVDVVKKAKQR